MYTITLQWLTRDKDFHVTLPSYTKQIKGDTLKECMADVYAFKYAHDLAHFTSAEIINVTED